MKIFVTVGTTEFRPLTDALAAAECLAKHEVVMQYGSARPAKVREGVALFDYARGLSDYIAASDLVISHAAAGTRLDVLSQAKPHIMVCNDSLAGNHQMEMVRANQKNPSCRVFANVGELLKYLETADLEKECAEMRKHVSNKAAGEEDFKKAVWGTLQWQKSDPLPRMILCLAVCAAAGLCLLKLLPK